MDWGTKQRYPPLAKAAKRRRTATVMFVLRSVRCVAAAGVKAAQQQRKERLKGCKDSGILSTDELLLPSILLFLEMAAWRYSSPRHCCFSSDRRWEVALAHLCKQCSSSTEHPVRSQVRSQNQLLKTAHSPI
jgi:hypothetical protein